MPSNKSAAELKNKNITIRTDMHQFEVIKSEAWRRKTNKSAMIRNILLEQFRREGVPEQQQA